MGKKLVLGQNDPIDFVCLFLYSLTAVFRCIQIVFRWITYDSGSHVRQEF